jgi:Carboxypeptidase regulatory-like domain
MSFSVRSSLKLKLCVALALSSSLSLAQNAVSTGAMTGTVHDPGGQVVAHAAVTAVNEATGERSTSSSNDVGIFSFPALKIGVYDVSVVSTGFKTVKIAGLVVAVGHTTDAEATLAIGEASDTVNVISDAGSALNPTDTTVGTLVQHETIEGLPLSGRRYTDLVLLTPNVVADGQFGHISFAGQSGGDLSGYNNTAGGASNANGSTSFTVDGVDSTSYYYGDNRGFTRIPYVFGLQSIQEFQVQANVYDSSYGGAGAGFINTVTKSGTNKFHGDAFYYNRNSATGANDAIDKANGNPRPLNVLQQFGADIGGPIIRDKMFFYFDYEQQRHKDPLYAVNTGQAATNLQSFAPAGYTYAPGVTLPTPNSHYPVAATISQNDATADPTNPIYLQGVANALNVIHSNLGPRARRRDDWELFPKFDWAISDKTHLTALYNYNHFQSAGGIITFSPESFGGDELLGDNGVRDHVATVHLTHTFSPSIVNDAYVSYVRDEQLYHPSGLAATPTSPQIVLLAPQTLLLGNPTFAYNNLREYQTQFADHVTFLHGKNQLDAGYSLNYDTISDEDPGTFYGQYVFFSLQSFALGKWGVFNQTAGNPKYNFSDPFMGFFVNDTYHLMPNLTVTGGIREDFQKYGNPAGNPLVPSTQKFNNQYQRISPRVGFSYNPFAKTVIRGGAGLYYEIFVGGNYQRSTQQNGVSQTSVAGFDAFTAASLDTIAANQSPSFPAAVPATDPRFAGGGSIVTVDSHYKTPSVVNASLQIDQEIAKGTILTVGSLWSHGMHLTSSTAYDQNLNAPTGTTTYVTPSGATISTEPNLDPGVLGEGRLTASLGQINALISPGIDNYNSLFVQLNRQASHDINFILSYTFAKSTQSGVDFYNQFDFSGTHGLSVLDQRQRFSIAGVYAPSLNSGSEFARAAANGWRVSLIAQVNTGHPYTGVIGSLNDTAELQATANTAAGLVGGNSPGYGLAPGDGINSFTGPGTAQVDLGIERAIKIKETQSITLKVQSFNLLNSANYFVYAGSGINQVQYTTSGATCGDGKTLNQTCTLTPNTGVGGFQTLTAVDQSHPPRIFQFSFAYKF